MTEEVKDRWEKVRLGEVCEFKYGKGLPQRKRINGEFPVYGSGGIVDSHKDYYVGGPGIIVGRKGTIGSVFFEKRDFFPIDTVFYIEENKKAYDIRFLYFMLLNLRLDKLNSDAAVPGLNRNVAYHQEILLPPLPSQKKIAAILSAYDDLIENNTRRIKILEEMGQTIYKEWFVKFRFPGHENVKMVDSELGKIPEGWAVKKLGEVSSFVMGQSPSSKFYNTDGEGLPFHQGVKDFGTRFPSHKTYCTVDKRVAEKGDVLVSVRAPVGRINIANSKLIVGRGLAALRHESLLQSFLFYQLKNIFVNEDSMGGGSIFNAVTKEDMSNIKFLVPNESRDRKFDELVGSLDKQIGILQTQIEKLRRTRDLLLPRLISGEIDVEDRLRI